MPHCSEAWDAIARYIYTGLQGGSSVKNHTEVLIFHKAICF